MAEGAQRGRDQVDEAGKLRGEAKPPEASGLNVAGRAPTHPGEGFGWLWRRTYSVRLAGKRTSPQEVVAEWKERLPDFMPDNSRFYPTLHGIEAGQIVYIDAQMPPAVPVATGVLVLESDDVHFTLITPQGHPESGYNTFSAFDEDGAVVAQIQSLARAADPLYELGFRFLGGMKHQEKIWRHVLDSLAQHYGLRRPQILTRHELLDRHVQWSKAGNVRHNAMIHTTLHTPIRLAGRLAGKTR